MKKLLSLLTLPSMALAGGGGVEPVLHFWSGSGVNPMQAGSIAGKIPPANDSNGGGNKPIIEQSEEIHSQQPKQIELDPLEQLALPCILAAVVCYMIKKKK